MEVQDLGNAVTFGVLVQKGRPVGSSGEVELRYASVGEWEDGKIARITNYGNIDEARTAAARLAEERGNPVSQAHVDLVLRTYPADLTSPQW